MKVSRVDNSPAFLRKPNSKEMKVYTESVQQGLQLLGKQVDVILHNSSAPAIAKENTGIGSLFSRTVAQKVIPFLKEHGITGIQQEPNGLRKPFDNSPYAPESNVKNVLMIPLEKLASKEYDNILSNETFEKIVQNNPSKTDVNYPYVRVEYEKALREAYANAQQNSSLQKEFKEFKALNESKYEQSAIFRIINKMYGNDDIALWANKISYTVKERQEVEKKIDINNWEKVYQDLYSPKTEKQAKIANAKIAELKENHKEDYDYFMFQQFILEKENAKANELSTRTNVKIIGDSPVASAQVDEWVNKNLYLDKVAIGAPPDYFSKNGQRWGFKYFNPKHIFNKDGSLGKAGEALKKKYEDYFASFPGGLRIDHVIGLVDPFIYSINSKKMTPENSGRIYSVFSGEYKKKNLNEYAALFNKIIIPAAEKNGISKENIICEDLGDPNLPTIKVMKKLNLTGLGVTQFDYRGSKVPEKNAIMIGSHDNPSFLESVDSLFDFGVDKDKKKRFMKKTRFLAQDTAPKSATKEDVKKLTNELRKDKSKFITASFAELFTSPARRIQIFFADLFGIKQTYNRPGSIEGCWSLRLGPDFEKEYYEAVAEKKAPNFAEAIATAIRYRGLEKGNEQLLKNLDDSAKILSEK